MPFGAATRMGSPSLPPVASFQEPNPSSDEDMVPNPDWDDTSPSARKRKNPAGASSSGKRQKVTNNASRPPIRPGNAAAGPSRLRTHNRSKSPAARAMSNLTAPRPSQASSRMPKSRQPVNDVDRRAEASAAQTKPVRRTNKEKRRQQTDSSSDDLPGPSVLLNKTSSAPSASAPVRKRSRNGLRERYSTQSAPTKPKLKTSEADIIDISDDVPSRTRRPTGARNSALTQKEDIIEITSSDTESKRPQRPAPKSQPRKNGEPQDIIIVSDSDDDSLPVTVPTVKSESSPKKATLSGPKLANGSSSGSPTEPRDTAAEDFSGLPPLPEPDENERNMNLDTGMNFDEDTRPADGTEFSDMHVDAVPETMPRAQSPSTVKTRDTRRHSEALDSSVAQDIPTPTPVPRAVAPVGDAPNVAELSKSPPLHAADAPHTPLPSKGSAVPNVVPQTTVRDTVDNEPHSRPDSHSPAPVKTADGPLLPLEQGDIPTPNGSVPHRFRPGREPGSASTAFSPAVPDAPQTASGSGIPLDSRSEDQSPLSSRSLRNKPDSRAFFPPLHDVDAAQLHPARRDESSSWHPNGARDTLPATQASSLLLNRPLSWHPNGTQDTLPKMKPPAADPLAQRPTPSLTASRPPSSSGLKPLPRKPILPRPRPSLLSEHADTTLSASSKPASYRSIRDGASETSAPALREQLGLLSPGQKAHPKLDLRNPPTLPLPLPKKRHRPTPVQSAAKATSSSSGQQDSSLPSPGMRPNSGSPSGGVHPPPKKRVKQRDLVVAIIAAGEHNAMSPSDLLRRKLLDSSRSPSAPSVPSQIRPASPPACASTSSTLQAEQPYPLDTDSAPHRPLPPSNRSPSAPSVPFKVRSPSPLARASPLPTPQAEQLSSVWHWQRSPS
ncbi:hypothetical protein C8J57DRAFT_66835 [Mycena rebaudengoi]|nr:hypothetical protein C8J57DRAFT_66835 [Mycena rebaudengoi]